MIEVRPSTDRLTAETARRVGSPTVVVTFTIEDRPDIAWVNVVGEFNEWSTTATPMEHRGGHFRADVELEAGRRYRFKYLVDGERWENDWAAHDYEPNFAGGDDSVVDLRGWGQTDPAPPQQSTVRMHRVRAGRLRQESRPSTSAGMDVDRRGLAGFLHWSVTKPVPTDAS